MTKKRTKTSIRSPGASELSLFVALIVLLICVFKIAILDLPDREYRILEYVSTDALLVILSIAGMIFLPHRNTLLRTIWASVLVWFIARLTYNIIIQGFFPDIPDLAVAFSGIVLAVLLLLAFRFIWHWAPGGHDIKPGSFYEIIGRPENLSQAALAVKTGAGGSFSITDGVKLWLFSNQTNSMVEILLPKNYSIGRVVVPICEISSQRYAEIRSMNDTPYDVFNNCEDIHNLANKWRKQCLG